MGFRVRLFSLLNCEREQTWRKGSESIHAADILSRFSFSLFHLACSTWVSTAEIFTTEIRTTGHSTSNAVARLGGSFSPYLVTASTPTRLIGSVLLAVSLCTAYATWNLPETAGKRLGTSLHHDDKGDNADDDDEKEHGNYEILRR